MRTNFIPALDRSVSVIGFGSASLGSRISGPEGMAAVRRAVDLGVNWFDTAPPYGDGQAEHWLGKALGGDRHRVIICTKVGIQRPKISPLKRVLRPIARAAVKAMPGIRSSISRARSTGDRPVLTPESIEPSVVMSLRQLGTDYIDVLALHEPPVEEVSSEEIRGAMQRLVEKGLVCALSVAGDSTIIHQAMEFPEFRFVQFPDSPFDLTTQIFRMAVGKTKEKTFVTHGVFGSSLLARFSALPVEQANAVQSLAEEHHLLNEKGQPDWPMLLLGAALSGNPEGVVIMSMFSPNHAEKNCQSANKFFDPSLAQSLHHLLKGIDQA